MLAMNSPSLYWSRNDDKSHHIVVCIYNHQYEYEYDNMNIHVMHIIYIFKQLHGVGCWEFLKICVLVKWTGDRSATTLCYQSLHHLFRGGEPWVIPVHIEISDFMLIIEPSSAVTFSYINMMIFICCCNLPITFCDPLL